MCLSYEIRGLSLNIFGYFHYFKAIFEASFSWHHCLILDQSLLLRHRPRRRQEDWIDLAPLQLELVLLIVGHRREVL